MIREVVKYPDSTLRKKANEVGEITDEIRKLAQDMKETMFVNQGVGLAAPQVGVLKRIIAIQAKIPSVFIDPKIIKKGRETISEQEGCLSFPGLFLKIKRAKEVEIEALDESGEKISLKARGLLAHVFQHEIDHLDGVLFINRLSFWQRLKIEGQLQKFKQQ